jgi:hypothetical protein
MGYMDLTHGEEGLGSKDVTRNPRRGQPGNVCKIIATLVALHENVRDGLRIWECRKVEVVNVWPRTMQKVGLGLGLRWTLVVGHAG